MCALLFETQTFSGFEVIHLNHIVQKYSYWDYCVDTVKWTLYSTNQRRRYKRLVEWLRVEKIFPFELSNFSILVEFQLQLLTNCNINIE